MVINLVKGHIICISPSLKLKHRLKLKGLVILGMIPTQELHIFQRINLAKKSMKCRIK